MLAERSQRRAPTHEDAVLRSNPMTPASIDAREPLTEFEWGMVRKIPLLRQQEQELKRAIAQRRERFQTFASLYVTHHPDKAGTVDVIETWAVAESQQPAGYRALVQDALSKAKQFLSEDAMILGYMREEAMHWLKLRQQLNRVEGTITNILPFAERVGRV